MKRAWETFKVKGDELLAHARRIIHEGNVRRIVIKQGGRTIAEFPVTVGVVGALGAPALAAIGALAALLTDCTLHVSRAEAKATPAEKKPSPPRPARKRTTRRR
jgi:hypothetical protein